MLKLAVAYVVCVLRDPGLLVCSLDHQRWVSCNRHCENYLLRSSVIGKKIVHDCDTLISGPSGGNSSHTLKNNWTN